jgi:hypothetical protein
MLYADNDHRQCIMNIPLYEELNGEGPIVDLLESSVDGPYFSRNTGRELEEWVDFSWVDMRS